MGKKTEKEKPRERKERQKSRDFEAIFWRKSFQNESKISKVQIC